MTRLVLAEIQIGRILKDNSGIIFLISQWNMMWPHIRTVSPKCLHEFMHKRLTSYQQKHPKSTTKPPDPILPCLSTKIYLQTGFSCILLMIKVTDLWFMHQCNKTFRPWNIFIWLVITVVKARHIYCCSSVVVGGVTCWVCWFRYVLWQCAEEASSSTELW